MPMPERRSDEEQSGAKGPAAEDGQQSKALVSSLSELFQHLEKVAARRKADWHHGITPAGTVPVRGADSRECPASALELARSILRAAAAQTRALQARVEAASILVLINNWEEARVLWEDVQPDFRTPVLELNFFCEISGLQPDSILVGGRTLEGHWQFFCHMRREIERLLRQREDMLLLSDLLEQLIPWLETLHASIGNLADVTDFYERIGED
jgi:hypothetical protein